MLDGKGYVLARQEELGEGGRAWSVQAVGASIARQTPSEQQFGNQPATIEIPMVWRTGHRGYGDDEQRLEGRYHYAINADCRFPEQIIPGPLVTNVTIAGSANVKGFFEQGSALYCIAGRYCKKIDSEYAVTTSKDFGSGKAATDCKVANGTVMVGMGYSEAFWKHTTATWTQASSLYMGQITPFRHSIYASTSGHEIKSFDALVDPATAANWSAAHDVGEPGQAISDMTELADLLYVGKADGLYSFNSWGMSVLLTPELRSVVDSANCAGMYAWHGSLWVPHSRGLLEYRQMGDQGFLVRSATPGADVDADNPVRGQVTALVGDNRWLYAALYSVDGDTYILAGREPYEDEQGLGRLIWHPIIKVASTKCEALHLSGLWTNPHLWMGLGVQAGYVKLPRDVDNPINDSNATYATACNVYFPSHSWGSPTTKKVWKSIELQAEKVTSARYVNVYYRVDDGGWTLAGKVSAPSRHILALPDRGVSGSKIEIRLDFVLPSTGNPLVVKALVVRGLERPNTMELITAAIRCADGLVLRGHRKSTRSGADMLTELKELSENDEAVILEDIVGLRRRVVVLPGIEEREVEQEGELPREVVAMVRMADFEIEETPPVSGAVGVYGTGLYGTDIYAR